MILWKTMMTVFAWGSFLLVIRHRDWLMRKNQQLYGLNWSDSFTKKYLRVAIPAAALFLIFWTFFLWFVVG